MNFLRTLFWIAVTIVVVVFSIRNWFSVTINLFGPLQADVKLPLLLLIAFLIGLLPTYFYYRAWRWRDARRRVAAERAAVVVPVDPIAPSPLDGV